ncbi:hypothetical protein [Scytonema hofmannii]|uniref:hypothetical protein n=1 Tax=Scytonema hofmannii TaxID=34078 RepID=UPI0013145830|nr:hypothetical protein [Scytonema hofmannii]
MRRLLVDVKFYCAVNTQGAIAVALQREPNSDRSGVQLPSEKSAIILHSIIWKLPSANGFNVKATTLGTNNLKIRIYPFITASTTVTENVVTVSHSNTRMPLV